MNVKIVDGKFVFETDNVEVLKALLKLFPKAQEPVVKPSLKEYSPKKEAKKSKLPNIKPVMDDFIKANPTASKSDITKHLLDLKYNKVTVSRAVKAL